MASCACSSGLGGQCHSSRPRSRGSSSSLCTGAPNVVPLPHQRLPPLPPACGSLCTSCPAARCLHRVSPGLSRESEQQLPSCSPLAWPGGGFGAGAAPVLFCQDPYLGAGFPGGWTSRPNGAQLQLCCGQRSSWRGTSPLPPPSQPSAWAQLLQIQAVLPLVLFRKRNGSRPSGRSGEICGG